jgi:DNA repair protein RecN (Recombination protein N)
MLSRLSVRDLALVERATVEFGPGLCVLTGETGAGKSLLVLALAALRGGRTSADIVRQGAEAAVIEAVFDGAAAAQVAPLLAELGLDAPGDSELVLRRQVGKDGRSRALVNDQVVTLTTLRALGERLIDLHGQHEHQVLLDEARHTALLDAAGGLTGEVAAVRAAREVVRETHQRLATARRARTERERHAAGLQALIAEVERLAPAADEIETLRAERERLRHADRIVEGLRTAGRLLSEEDGAALDRIGASEGLFRQLAAIDPALAPAQEGLFQARVQIEEVVRETERRLAEFERDPAERLTAIEDRLVRLESLARRQGTLAAAIAAADAARRELAGEGTPDDAALARAVTAALAALRNAARELSAARERAAERLSKAVARELAALGFPAGAFRAALEPHPPGAEPAGDDVLAAADHVLSRIGDAGQETARFLLAPNPGEGFHPLDRTAAGGELARVMLALRTALSGEGGGSILVFDEVDTGVGGVVLDHVADRLKRLAAHRQVLCVTHQARIAARAHLHLVVEKEVRAGRTATRVTALDRAGRLAEIERLLAGREPGPRAHALATELLERHAPAGHV